jgi:hypothetical protein
MTVYKADQSSIDVKVIRFTHVSDVGHNHLHRGFVRETSSLYKSERTVIAGIKKLDNWLEKKCNSDLRLNPLDVHID